MYILLHVHLAMNKQTRWTVGGNTWALQRLARTRDVITSWEWNLSKLQVAIFSQQPLGTCGLLYETMSTNYAHVSSILCICIIIRIQRKYLYRVIISQKYIPTCQISSRHNDNVYACAGQTLQESHTNSCCSQSKFRCHFSKKLKRSLNSYISKVVYGVRSWKFCQFQSCVFLGRYKGIGCT